MCSASIPDDDALNKAINQINAEIDAANVKKIKMGLEKEMAGPAEAIPASWLEQKFGKVGTVIDNLIGKSKFGDIYKGLTGVGGSKEEGADKSSSGIMGAIIGGAGGGGGGAAAGAAVGGDAMIAYEAIKVLAEGIGYLGAAPFKMINAGLGGISTALQGMQGPLGPIGASLDVLGANLSGFSDMVKKVPVVGELFGPMLGAFAALPGLIGSITSSLVSMAGKASPAVLEHFNHALEDAQATIGEAFLPVVEAMTEVIENMSDVIANVMEALKPVIGDIGAIFKELGNIFKELAPLLKILVIPLKILSTILLGLAKVVSFVASVIGKMLKPLLDLLGLGGDDTKTRTTAARTPTLGGIAEYQQKLQLQTAAGPAGDMDVPTNVSTISNKVGSIDGSLKRIEKHLSKDDSSDKNDVRESIDQAEDRKKAG